MVYRTRTDVTKSPASRNWVICFHFHPVFVPKKHSCLVSRNSSKVCHVIEGSFNSYLVTYSSYFVWEKQSLWAESYFSRNSFPFYLNLLHFEERIITDGTDNILVVAEIQVQIQLLHETLLRQNLRFLWNCIMISSVLLPISTDMCDELMGYSSHDSFLIK